MNDQPTTVANPNHWIEISDGTRLLEKPVVSVLMLAYNHGPYLAEAIEGVLMQQTDFPIELLIGEDCSTDNTREIALRYQRENPHLVRIIISDRNVGMHDNAERLIHALHGEFIAFCDGDDYWIESTKLQKQVSLLRTHNDVTAVFSDFVIADLRSGHWTVDFAANAFAHLQVSDLRGNLRTNPLDGRLRTLTAVYRLNVLTRLYEKKLPMKAYPFLDNFFLAQAVASGNVERIDTVTGVYRRSPGSATRSDARNNLLFLQSARRFHEQLHVFFPEIERTSKVTLTDLDIAICRAAYIAGNFDAYEKTYSRLRAEGRPMPSYLAFLRRLVRWEGMRRLTVGVRSRVRAAKRTFV